MARKDPSEPTSFKGLPESLEVGDFGDRLALPLTLADGLSRITERPWRFVAVEEPRSLGLAPFNTVPSDFVKPKSKKGSGVIY